jgi:hypothetical protein
MVEKYTRFTDEDIVKDSKPESLPEGTFRFVITKADKKVSQSEKTGGCEMISMRVAALKDPEDVTSKVRPEMIFTLMSPFPNPEVEGHVPPKQYRKMWVDGAHDFLTAIFDDLPRKPYWDKDAGSLVFDGENINKTEEEACAEKAVRGVYEKFADLLDGEYSELPGCAFYGKVVKSEKDGRCNIRYPKAALWPNEQLSSLDEDDAPVARVEEVIVKKPIKKAAKR